MLVLNTIWHENLQGIYIEHKIGLKICQLFYLNDLEANCKIFVAYGSKD